MCGTLVAALFLHSHSTHTNFPFSLQLANSYLAPAARSPRSSSPKDSCILFGRCLPKGYSELIFKDAAARIRKTGQEFQYQLVVQRVYEEGEAELLAEEEGEDAETDPDLLAAERDEKTFLLDEALHFRIEKREGTEIVLAWRDLSGDVGMSMSSSATPAFSHPKSTVSSSSPGSASTNASTARTTPLPPTKTSFSSSLMSSPSACQPSAQPDADTVHRIHGLDVCKQDGRQYWRQAGSGRG